MTKNKLLGISLAMVMLLGSTPFGFSEPLKSQLEQGIEIDQLYCSNESHVLVERTNGKMACVSERTADRTGWKILNNISLVEYEFPITVTSVDETPADSEMLSRPAYPKFGDVEISISNMPNIGETAELTVTFTNTVDVPIDWDLTGISLSDNFEFVDSKGVTNDPVLDYVIHKKITLDSFVMDGTTTKTISIKAIGNGVGYITGYYGAYTASIETFISENTMLLADYEKTNGLVKKSAVETHIDTILVDGVEKQVIVENEPENSDAKSKTSIENQLENSDAKSKTSIDNQTPREITQEWIADGVPLEEIRELLRNGGHTLKEIEAFIANSTEYDDQAHTQGTEFGEVFPLSHSFILRGKIINTPSIYDPSPITNVFGTTVCAADKNLTTNAISIIAGTNGLSACVKTSSSGLYYITNISIVDPDNDNTNVDLSLFYYSDGHYVDIIDENNFYYAATVYGGVENIHSATWTFNHDLTVYNTYHRVANIQDTLTDARDWFDDKDVDLDPILVIWQHDKTVGNINNAPNCTGACYFPSLSRMYLDGTVGNALGDEHRIWTQTHEYGHHVMREAYGPTGWGGCTIPHYFSSVNTETCAWSEGWADYVPHILTDESRIEWFSGVFIDLEQHAFYNSAGNRGIEWQSINQQGDEVGHLVESRVASMLWDLRDDNEHYPYDRLSIFDPNLDTLDETDEDIFDAFSNLKSITEQFYITWNAQNPLNKLTNIAKLHHMGFANTAPVATPNSIQLLQDASTTFWLRGTDVDVGTELEFEITDYPNYGTLTEAIGTFPLSQLYSYEPDNGFSGTDYFKFKVNDGTVYSDDDAQIDIMVIPLIPITFTTSWNSETQLVLVFSERLDTVFSISDFTLSAGNIDGVTNYSNSAVRYLAVSSIPYDTPITVTYTASTLNLGDGGSHVLESNESSVTPGIPTPDRNPPTITPPADITKEATAVLTPVNIGMATATDDTDPNSSITNDADDYITNGFPLGDTRITWTATDNSGKSSTAPQYVTITDTTNPIITSPADIQFEATGILTTLTSTDYGLATGSDIFTPVRIDNDAPTTFPFGDTTFTWTATDANGLQSTTTQTITIIDIFTVLNEPVINVGYTIDASENIDSMYIDYFGFSSSEKVDAGIYVTDSNNNMTFTEFDNNLISDSPINYRYDIPITQLGIAPGDKIFLYSNLENNNEYIHHARDQMFVNSYPSIPDPTATNYLGAPQHAESIMLETLYVVINNIPADDGASSIIYDSNDQIIWQQQDTVQRVSDLYYKISLDELNLVNGTYRFETFVDSCKDDSSVTYCYSVSNFDYPNHIFKYGDSKTDSEKTMELILMDAVTNDSVNSESSQTHVIINPNPPFAQEYDIQMTVGSENNRRSLNGTFNLVEGAWSGDFTVNEKTFTIKDISYYSYGGYTIKSLLVIGQSSENLNRHLDINIKWIGDDIIITDGNMIIYKPDGGIQEIPIIDGSFTLVNTQ